MADFVDLIRDAVRTLSAPTAHLAIVAIFAMSLLFIQQMIREHF